jgi:hypothetical protein
MASSDGTLEALERRTSALFLVGAAMFVVSAVLNGVQIVASAERLVMIGEAFIASGWIAGLLGLLGLYPGLADRNRWLSRGGAVFAVIGILAFVVLAVVSLYGYAAGYDLGNFPIPVVFFIPGVFVGSLLAFVSFSGACLRSDAHSRRVGLLLLVPSAIFVTNLFVLPMIFGTGSTPPAIGIVVVSGLALAMFAIGYSLRAEANSPASAEQPADTAV